MGLARPRQRRIGGQSCGRWWRAISCGLDIQNHGALKLTAKSDALRGGDIRFAYRTDVMGPSDLYRPKRAKSALPDLDPADKDLFEGPAQCPLRAGARLESARLCGLFRQDPA